MNNGNCSNCKAYNKSAFGNCEVSFITKNISDHNISLTFQKGQDIYLENSLVKGVFCLKKGKVKVYKTCDGRCLTIGLATDGDLLGFTSLFDGGKYINSARCLEDSVICFIPEKNFKKLLSINTDLLLELLKRSSVENYRLSNIISSLKCKNTLGRVAITLSDIAEKFGTDENGFFTLTLTRRDISEMSGTTTESAIRILNDLKKENVISFQNNRIKILDSVKLRKYHSN
ncbi:MAG: Crp/Fnr family transcriptional regulator [Bacteroidia bacterium]